MAEIKPFRAWRYNIEDPQEIEDLTSPLFDVVSEKQRESLYQNKFNSIHLSVPSSENPAESAKRVLQEWKNQQVIKQDNIPGIYSYYQYFTLPGSKKEYCRKGFVCFIKIYDWDEKVILRHENTIPKAVNDRIEILDKTQLNVSPTHGLYSDSSFELEKYLDESMVSPLYETEDYQGVRDVLSVIHDARLINRFIEVVNDQQIILADGHHRYEGSLAYKKMKEKQKKHRGDEGYNYHMIYLTNSEADDLRILPTHRLIQNIDQFDQNEFLKKLEPYFIFKPVPNVYDINEIILGKKWAFGLILKDRAIKIRLKPEFIEKISWKIPDIIKNLDLTVLHYYVIYKVLGISKEEQRFSEKISFERNFAECLTKVFTEEAQMALITQDISMEEVVNVCRSGYTMPQKSTYFYPKVICGYLFGSIRDDEFGITDFGF